MQKIAKKIRATRSYILMERRKKLAANPRKRHWRGNLGDTNQVGKPLIGKPQKAHWIPSRDVKQSRQQFKWPTGGEGGSLGLLENKIRGLLKVRRDDNLQFLRRGNTYFVRLYKNESLPEKGTRGVQYFKVTNPEIIKGLDFLLDVKRK